MKKEDKEKLITELRYKYIESLDNYSTKVFYQKLGVVGAIITFLISFNLLKISNLNSTGLIVALLFLVYILNMNRQYEKYVDDLYEYLFVTIKSDELLKFKVRSRNFWQRNFFYKKRYK